jgi:hypothetical protein
VNLLYANKRLAKIILKRYFERTFWKDVLRRSGNNPPDLLYNSNKPSNAIRPRGLGGTPIKTNHPKRRKLCFYPPEISYLRPLYYYLVRLAPSWHCWHLFGRRISTNRANQKSENCWHVQIFLMLLSPEKVIKRR